MQELQQSPEAASWLASALATVSTLFWKFMPGPLGAAVMLIFDTPETKRELFGRLVVAYIFTVMFGDLAFDFLRTLSWLSFLDHAKKTHTAGVDFLLGGCGWSALAALSVMLRKFRADPMRTIEEGKRVGP